MTPAQLKVLRAAKRWRKHHDMSPYAYERNRDNMVFHEVDWKLMDAIDYLLYLEKANRRRAKR